MNLAIDIGNSFVHFGVFRGKLLLECKTVSGKSIPALKGTLRRLIAKHDLAQIGIASVNPKSETIIKKNIPTHFRKHAVTINNKSKLPITIKVKNSGTLGADRICNAVYGHLKAVGKSSLIIDLGTANTYDLVLKNGNFVGGIIAPGLFTSALALNKNTAKLPFISIEGSRVRVPLIGKNTREAISSGLLNYMLFATEGIVTAVKNQYGRNFEVFLTGGSAPLIAKKVNFEHKLVQNTVLEGINMIINHNSL